MPKKKYLPPDTKAGIFWTTNRMPDKWRRVQKHEVQVERKSSEELLNELHAKLLELKAEGYLEGLVVPALPPPKTMVLAKYTRPYTLHSACTPRPVYVVCTRGLTTLGLGMRGARSATSAFGGKADITRTSANVR
jgi:hypothetical protein